MDRAHQACRQGFAGRENPPGKRPFERLRDPDDARQEPARAGLRRDAAAHEHEAEPCLLGGEPYVHRQQHGRTDADRRPIDGGDHRLEAGKDAQRHPSPAVARGVTRQVRLTVGARRNLRPVGASRAIECRATGGEVRPGTERPPRPGDDHRLHGVVLVGPVEGVDQLGEHLGRERIELVGSIERDREDRILDLVADGFIGHRLISPCRHDWADSGCTRACSRSYGLPEPHTRFPSPLAGEGGRSECNEGRPGEG